METQAESSSRPKPLVFHKMEVLVRQMQSQDTGVPVRCQKLFLTTIPSAFMGYDLVEWLMANLPIEDSAEALHLSSLLCQHGYFFPVGDARTLQVKDDSSLYRFQTPYYWPSQNHTPDSTDYAIYLHKKFNKNRQKGSLDDHEMECYSQLRKSLTSKWDFISMQADEQLKMAKDRKKGDKIVSESQERAYWRVYRPPPGFTNTLELPLVPQPSRSPGSRPVDLAYLRKQVTLLQKYVSRSRVKMSQVFDTLVSNFETYQEFDPLLIPVLPSNPWLTDDPTFMELNQKLVECPTEQRVRRWAISVQEIVSDPTGLAEFTKYMKKEFCHENIRFWMAVYKLRKAPLKQVNDMVQSIYDEFLRPGAPCEINIDGKTMEITQERLKKPDRTSFDCAAEHIFELLLKKDCYPRFLRSDQYKALLMNATNPTSKKRFFPFGAVAKKKISTISPPNAGQIARPDDLGAAAGAVTSSKLTVQRLDDQPYRREDDAGIFLGDTPTTVQTETTSASRTVTCLPKATSLQERRVSIAKDSPITDESRPVRIKTSCSSSGPIGMTNENQYSDAHSTAATDTAHMSSTSVKSFHLPIESEGVSKVSVDPVSDTSTTPTFAYKPKFPAVTLHAICSDQTSQVRQLAAAESKPIEDATSTIIDSSDSDMNKSEIISSQFNVVSSGGRTELASTNVANLVPVSKLELSGGKVAGSNTQVTTVLPSGGIPSVASSSNSAALSTMQTSICKADGACSKQLMTSRACGSKISEASDKYSETATVLCTQNIEVVSSGLSSNTKDHLLASVSETLLETGGHHQCLDPSGTDHSATNMSNIAPPPLMFQDERALIPSSQSSPQENSSKPLRKSGVINALAPPILVMSTAPFTLSAVTSTLSTPSASSQVSVTSQPSALVHKDNETMVGVRRRTQIVTLTDNCAQTEETGDNPIYDTSEQQCEVNMVCAKRSQVARRREKRGSNPHHRSQEPSSSKDRKPIKKKHSCKKNETRGTDGAEARDSAAYKISVTDKEAQVVSTPERTKAQDQSVTTSSLGSATVDRKSVVPASADVTGPRAKNDQTPVAESDILAKDGHKKLTSSKSVTDSSPAKTFIVRQSSRPCQDEQQIGGEAVDYSAKELASQTVCSTAETVFVAVSETVVTAGEGGATVSSYSPGRSRDGVASEVTFVKKYATIGYL